MSAVESRRPGDEDDGATKEADGSSVASLLMHAGLCIGDR